MVVRPWRGVELVDISYLNGTDQRQIALWSQRVVEAFKARIYLDRTTDGAPNRQIAQQLADGLPEAIGKLERALNGQLLDGDS